MKELEKKIDEVLAGASKYPVNKRKATQALTIICKEYAMEIVGEDEFGNIGYVGEYIKDDTSEEMLIRNDLRASQRKAIEEDK